MHGNTYLSKKENISLYSLNFSSDKFSLACKYASQISEIGKRKSKLQLLFPLAHPVAPAPSYCLCVYCFPATTVLLAHCGAGLRILETQTKSGG